MKRYEKIQIIEMYLYMNIEFVLKLNNLYFQESLIYFTLIYIFTSHILFFSEKNNIIFENFVKKSFLKYLVVFFIAFLFF